MVKLKTFLFFTLFLISLLSISVSEGQTYNNHLPLGVIKQYKHGDSVNCVALSPDGKLLASGGEDSTVILWNVTDGSKLKVFTGPSKMVMSTVFSPDGQILASASHDGFVRLWDVASKRRRTTFTHGGWVNSIAFSPDGKMLVSGGEVRDEAVKLWDVDASQNHLIASFLGHNNTVESVTFSSDGKYLASTSRDNTVKIWDVPNQQLQRNLTKHKNIVYSVAFHLMDKDSQPVVEITPSNCGTYLLEKILTSLMLVKTVTNNVPYDVPYNQNHWRFRPMENTSQPPAAITILGCGTSIIITMLQHSEDIPMQYFLLTSLLMVDNL